MCKALSKSVSLLGSARDLEGRMLKYRAGGKSRGLGGFAGQPSLQKVGLQGEGTELEGPWNSLETTKRPRNWDDGVEAE